MCILARQFVVIYCFSPSRQKAVLIYRTVDVCVVFAVDCYPVASAMYAPRRRRIVGYTCVSYQCITRPWLFVCHSQTQSTIFRVHRYGRCLYDRWIVVYIFKISAAIWPRPFTRQCKNRTLLRIRCSVALATLVLTTCVVVLIAVVVRTTGILLCLYLSYIASAISYSVA